MTTRAGLIGVTAKLRNETVRALADVPRAAMKIAVAKGVVELSGTITDERERTALRVLCENIGGVKSVIDHLAWVDPLSGMAVEPPDEKGR